MICINLYGGAGIGKSTLAAKIFAVLKERNVLVEIAGDYPKDLVYEKSYHATEDSEYMFAVLAHKLKAFKESGIEVAICDSPLLTATAYLAASHPFFNDYAFEVYNDYANVDLVLERHENSEIRDVRKGNIRNAYEIDQHIREMLDEKVIGYEVIDPYDPDIAEYICDVLVYE